MEITLIDKLKKRLRIDFDKNTKLLFYLKGIWIILAPSYIYKKKLEQSYQELSKKEKEYIENRVSYYNKLTKKFNIEDKISIKNFNKYEKKKTYFFDLLEYLKYFNQNFKISYLFGDITYIPDTPSLLKSRPISKTNNYSILMKLDKVRHFIFVKDEIKFKDKIDKLIWRGKVHTEQPHRAKFMEKCIDIKSCDIGMINKKSSLPKRWLRDKKSLKEHFKYKFILAIEGNDVASNLKWAMSSNSLVMMTKPIYETWFMEDRLKANFHYVLIDDNYNNLEEKIDYYSKNIQEAEKIIDNAHNYCNQFKNKLYEDIISYKVLEKYFKYSNQIS